MTHFLFRKRMSVIVRDTQNEAIILMCKGADSVIFERLQSSPDIAVRILDASRK